MLDSSYLSQNENSLKLKLGKLCSKPYNTHLRISTKMSLWLSADIWEILYKKGNLGLCDV